MASRRTWWYHRSKLGKFWVLPQCMNTYMYEGSSWVPAFHMGRSRSLRMYSQLVPLWLVSEQTGVHDSALLQLLYYSVQQ